MDRIQKLLLKLNKKERSIFLKIFEDIFLLKLKDYDIKAIKGYKGFFRLRKGKTRIIFAKQSNKGIIADVGFRKDVYKNF